MYAKILRKCMHFLHGSGWAGKMIFPWSGTIAVGSGRLYSLKFSGRADLKEDEVQGLPYSLQKKVRLKPERVMTRPGTAQVGFGLRAIPGLCRPLETIITLLSTSLLLGCQAWR